MTPTSGAPWLRALGLEERAAVEPQRGGTEPGEWARERLDRWRSRFQDEGRFAWRLALAGLDEDALLRLLAGQPSNGGAPPSWWRALEHAYTEARPRRPRAPDPRREADPGDGALRFVRPVLVTALDALCERAERHAARGVLEEPRRTSRALLEPLALELVEIVIRTLLLELHVAALDAGDERDPAEQARAFFAALERPERALELYREYPVLARLVVERAQLGGEAASELLDRLGTDAEALASAGLLDEGPLRLERTTRLGDSHDGARAVVALSFSGGARLVYKPRPLAFEAAYGRLLRWLGQAGLETEVLGVRMVERNGYGWQEAASHEPVHDAEATSRFYERLGAHLAVLHALCATDIHRENLLAHGEHPLIVDLETLFHPRLGGPAADQADPLTGPMSPLAVTRVGLLPGAEFEMGMDYSGLGGEGELERNAVEADEGALPRVVRRRTTVPAGHHRPSGSPAQPWSHSGAICRGFDAAYRILLERRAGLLARTGPLQAFAAADNRVVLRSTVLYSRLLEESLRPDYLRDALDRDRLLDGLWLVARSRPDLPPVVPAEIADLRRGDIPRFTSRPGSTRVRHMSAGAIEGAVGPGLAPDARSALDRLGEADLERQLAFVRASLAAANPDAVQPVRRVEPAANAPTRDALLAASAVLARRIGILALRGDSVAGWLAPTNLDDGRLVLRSMDHGLAEGVAGVAVYLAWHGELTGDPGALELAREAAEPLRRLEVADGGLLAGAGGVAWALGELAGLWDEAELLEEALRMTIEAGAAPASQERDDVAGGVAGLAAGALRLRLVPGAPAAELASLLEGCAKRLATTKTPRSGGFATGAAGIAVVLLDLATVCASSGAREAGLTLIDSLPPVGCGSWMHGTAGQAVALARAIAEEPTSARHRALRAAAQATEQHAREGNHSLGHGALGALDALVIAAAALEDDELAARAARIAAAIAAEVQLGRALCGTPGGVEHPGLLSGLAGIGLGLLRFAEPDRVSSPLLPGMSAA